MRKKLSAIFLVLTLFACGVQIPAAAGGVLVWPVPASGTISQGYHNSNAIDISAGVGTPVVAAMGGQVTSIYLCTQTHYSYGDCNGFGTGLVIYGDDGRTYQYAHMQGGSIPANVYYGARVEAGQQIGCVGQTGYAYGPHLHFGISNSTRYWDAGPDPANETYGNAGGDDVGESTDVWFSDLRAENVTTCNAKLCGTLHKDSGTWISSVGLYLGTAPNTMTRVNTEDIGSAANHYNGGYSFDIWYDLNSELGFRLKQGTTYYYAFYGVKDGEIIVGDVSAFVTGGTAPTQPTTVEKSKTVITVSDVTLTKSGKAQTFSLNATVNSGGKLTYSSDNKSVKVDSKGKVTVAKNFTGTATITVKAAAKGNYKKASKKVTVTVKAKPVKATLTAVSVASKPRKLTYQAGDALKTDGLKLKAAYSDGSTKTVTSGPVRLLTAGKQTVTVTYQDKKTTFTVTVKGTSIQKKLTSLSVAAKPDVTAYRVGDTLNAAGLKLTARYNDGTTKTVTSGYTCTPTALGTVGTQTVTVSYQGKTASFNVSVRDFTFDEKVERMKQTDGFREGEPWGDGAYLYAYKNVVIDSRSCCAKARQMQVEIFGSWSRNSRGTDPGLIRPGDVVHYYQPGGGEHWFFVTGVNGSTIYAGHGNFSQKVHYNSFPASRISTGGYRIEGIYTP